MNNFTTHNLSDFLENIFKTKELTELIENVVDDINGIGGSLFLHKQTSYSQSFFANRIDKISDEIDNLYMFPSISITDIEHHFQMLTKNNSTLKPQYANDFLKQYSEFFDLIISFGYPKLILTDGSIPYLKLDDSKFDNTFPDERKIFRYTLPSETLELIDYMLKMLEGYLEETKKDNTTQQSYEWLGKPEDELPELYKEMVNNGYLARESTIEQFKAVFDCKPINEDFKPLKWLKLASELLYFILRLQETNNIKSGRLNHKRMIACFVDSESKKFNENFSVLAVQLKDDLKNPLSKNKRDDIDTLMP